MDPGDATEIDVFELDATGLEKHNIDTLPSSLWEAYHALEQDEIVKSSLGDHVYKQFMDLKKKEWDDYRIQVFPYEVNRYLMI